MEYPNTISKGLNNLGNTCFFNSVLQLLYQCTVLNKLIVCNNIEGTIINKYSEYLNSYINSTKSFSPSDIISHVSNILGRRGYQQEDAEQYLNFLIDAIIDELKTWSKKSSLSDTIITKDISLDTLIKSLFTLEIKKTITCALCSHKSESADDINKLYLSIDYSDKLSSELSFDTLIQKYLYETLDNDNKYKCEKCKQYSNASISRQIIKMPKYLIVVLKRYTNSNRKINLDIQMPINFNASNKKYHMRGYIYHSGSTNGGHYVYYGNRGTTDSDKWYIYNDSSVNEINSSTFNETSANAYVYLYVSK
jgi:ubiquitin C-terminal hydrolase